MVVQATSTEEAALMLQGGSNVGKSLLHSLLLSSGVGELISVKLVDSPQGDISFNSDTSSFFSTPWHAGVVSLAIIIIVALVIIMACCMWRYKKRHNKNKPAANIAATTTAAASVKSQDTQVLHEGELSSDLASAENASGGTALADSDERDERSVVRRNSESLEMTRITGGVKSYESDPLAAEEGDTGDGAVAVAVAIDSTDADSVDPPSGNGKAVADDAAPPTDTNASSSSSSNMTDTNRPATPSANGNTNDPDDIDDTHVIHEPDDTFIPINTSDSNDL